jgi:hypothetical protein
MTEEELKFFVDEWITQGEDTNDYFNRSLIVSALKEAEEGNAEEAARRLRQVVPPPPGTSYILVDRPDFMVKHEEGKKL